jgi:uncharacterized protein YdeI (BOF family)/exonuclease III
MKQKLLLFFVMVFAFTIASESYAQQVFINEIHYDNASTDVDEAIEIAGPAGTDLTGWTILLYNGSGGAVYGTRALTGVIPNQQNGFGAIVATYPANGIQNGSPDGIALVDASNNVVQFISYEGNFTAVGGAANGMLSTDIGVAENGTEAIGNSLQLTGTGAAYSDFAWHSSSASSPGNINTGQFFGTPTISALINEFVFNHTGSNTNEFVEVISNPNTNLSNYSLVSINGNTTESGNVNGVIQLGSTDSTGLYVTPFYSDYFENGTLSLLLVKNFNGSIGADLDTNDDGILDILAWETVIDDIAVTDGDLGDNTYSSVVLPTSLSGGSATVGGASRIPNGVDTGTASDWVRNDFEGQGLPAYPDALAANGEAINTPGSGNQVAVVIVESNIIINEVDADTPGSDVSEFIELYDGGVGNVPLNGYVLVLYNGNDDKSYASYDLSGYSTNSEGYFVIGNSAVSNVSIVFANNLLQNGPDAVALYKGTSANFPNGTSVTTDNLVDALVYDTDDADDAGLLVLLNSGQVQVNESGQGNSAAQSMQRFPNGEGGNRNTVSYTLSIPTPGTINGGTVPTEKITILEARNVTDGTNVTVSGVLTVSDQFKGAAYLQDATGGIAVFDAKVHGAGLFNIGDSITITGTKTTYNGQTEISPVTTVTDNGLPNNPISPVNVLISELSSHPDELIRILNPVFSQPGAMMFGNSNYQISDGTGNVDLRIDADAPNLAGLAQPDSCSEIIGVVGKFNELFQLLPRIPSDISCAGKYQPSGDDLNISKDLTLDVAAWNIEWFGDEGNSPAKGNPNSDQIQKDSVKAVLLALDADIIGVEEISDDALFAQMVSEMPGYNYVLSNATSYPNDAGVKQKVGFIYKTSTISPVSTKVLLASIHPYYNGGNASYLTNYPEAADRFYASGRMPFMLTADVNINGATKRISFIDLHARANSSDNPQLRYDMRKFDVEVLKDTLDAYYANENIIMVGDYNDDVDFTVADISSIASSFQAYVDDTTNYNIETAELSTKGYRSYVFEKDMIDHIMLSNELNSNYIPGSTRVHYEFYDGDYANTTSDHMPVSARVQLETLELVSIEKTDVSCYGGNDGTATVTVKGGIGPYSYEWNNNQTSQTITGLASGDYSVIVTDASGNSISAQIFVDEAAPMVLNLGESKTVYYGYAPAACTSLSAIEISGGTPSYTYEWSNGATSESINVCPTQTSTYSLSVTDANNCSVTSDILVKVVDVRCSIGRIPGVIVCYYGYSFCVPAQLVPYLSPYGVKLGRCNQTKSTKLYEAESLNEMKEVYNGETRVFPNPFVNQISLVLESDENTDVEFLFYNMSGKLIHSESRFVLQGQSKQEFDLDQLQSGTYILRTIGLKDRDFKKTIIKQ